MDRLNNIGGKKSFSQLLVVYEFHRTLVLRKPIFERKFGHFVRVLVEIELINDLKSKVLV
jgi:hypothetical protein